MSVEYDSDDEFRIEKETVACNIDCVSLDGECRITCSRVVRECLDNPFGYDCSVEGIEIVDKGKIPNTEFRDIISKAKELNETEGVPVTIDTTYGRLLVDNGKVIGAVSPNKESCMVLLERSNIDTKEATAVDYGQSTACFPDRILREHQNKDISDALEYIETHPLLKLLLAKYYKYVNTTNMCLIPYDVGVSGFFDDVATFNIAINDSEISLKALLELLGVNSREEDIEEILHTMIHEQAHFEDAINNIKYKGGWFGETPLETLAVILSNKPLPAGREKSAETIATEISEILKRIDHKVSEKINNLLDEAVRRHKEDEELMEDIKKLREAMKKEDLFFGGTVYVHRGITERDTVLLSIHKNSEVYDTLSEEEKIEYIAKILKKYGLKADTVYSGGFIPAKFPAVVLKAIIYGDLYDYDVCVYLGEEY